MYDIIYAEMEDAGVAISIEEVFMNKTGEIFSEGEKYGRGKDIKITYPKYIYFYGKNRMQHFAKERWS